MDTMGNLYKGFIVLHRPIRLALFYATAKPLTKTVSLSTPSSQKPALHEKLDASSVLPWPL